MSTRAKREDSEDDRKDSGNARGRQAEKPSELPKAGWRDILLRVKREISHDNLSIVAAGIVYYTFLAMVPALVAVIAIYGLVATPADITKHLEVLAQVAPPDIMPMLEEQMTRIVADRQSAGFGAILGIAVALFGSSKAIRALMTGLNITYDEREKRGFIKLYGTSLVLTLGGIVGILALLALLTVLPPLLESLPLTSFLEQALILVRWPVLVLLFAFALAILYRFGPCRDGAQWRWLSWGAAVAASLWLLVSIGFSLYVTNFGNYDKVYGPLGAIVVFLMWMYLTMFVILIGAELNAEMERQTERDTTEGEPEPRGQRGAYAADTVGQSPPSGSRARG